MVLTFSLNAQVEQISVRPSYSQQTYYKFSTGEVTQVDNDAWDIAFSNKGIQDVGVFINESASLAGIPLKVFVAETTAWNEAITNTDNYNEQYSYL